MNINQIVNDIIDYHNNDDLNFIQVFKQILNKYGNFSDQEKNRILLSVVKELTNQGYDIVDKPFKLIRF